MINTNTLLCMVLPRSGKLFWPDKTAKRQDNFISNLLFLFFSVTTDK